MAGKAICGRNKKEDENEEKMEEEKKELEMKVER